MTIFLVVLMAHYVSNAMMLLFLYIEHHALYQHHLGVLREQSIASDHDQSHPGDIYHTNFTLGCPAS